MEKEQNPQGTGQHTALLWTIKSGALKTLTLAGLQSDCNHCNLQGQNKKKNDVRDVHTPKGLVPTHTLLKTHIIYMRERESNVQTGIRVSEPR